jgi:hypothetical protein
MTSKLNFSAIPGHVERESALASVPAPVLDFSAIPGHAQHSTDPTLAKATEEEPATVTWE